MRNFMELKVWQKAHQLVLEVYYITREFLLEERYGIVSQIRRSAASIPANIAEGCGRESDREFSHFMNIASGSACETEYHILLAHDLNFLQDDAYTELIQQVNEIKRMLRSFIKYLKPKTKTQHQLPKT